MKYPCTSSHDADPEVMKRGEDWYQVILKKARLEPRYNGHYLVVDTDTGVYFLGAEVEETLSRAINEVGNKNFYIEFCKFF